MNSPAISLRSAILLALGLLTQASLLAADKVTMGFVYVGPKDDYGYNQHTPDYDLGVIAPTAALSSFPYTPDYSMDVLRTFLGRLRTRLWTPRGLRDAFCETRNWYASSSLAIDQGPIVVMIENHRSALLWNLFMSCPETAQGLRRLGFSSDRLPAG